MAAHEQLLPPAVELMQLTGLAKDSYSELKWNTSREKDNDYLEIERSVDVEHFTVIGRVKGAADSQTISNYSFIDKFNQHGNNFYQLKLVDKAGDWEYSKTIMHFFLNANSIDNSTSVYLDAYPNPASGDITVNLPIPNKNGILMSIFSVTGERQNQIEIKENKVVQMDISYLVSGLYFWNYRYNTHEIIGRANFIKP